MRLHSRFGTMAALMGMAFVQQPELVKTKPKIRFLYAGFKGQHDGSLMRADNQMKE